MMYTSTAASDEGLMIRLTSGGHDLGSPKNTTYGVMMLGEKVPCEFFAVTGGEVREQLPKEAMSVRADGLSLHPYLLLNCNH